ncbi:hypothetical protein [Burkholderia pseudomultivorans]|uniref:hypothetical protein n=1 Tax=Burkholderia pseudomultivorans TaxID=1207504 RepID=UPI000B33BF0A|nr:hypothetical protein [Burkholderia pseudomultivorans]
MDASENFVGVSGMLAVPAVSALSLLDAKAWSLCPPGTASVANGYRAFCGVSRFLVWAGDWQSRNFPGARNDSIEKRFRADVAQRGEAVPLPRKHLGALFGMAAVAVLALLAGLGGSRMFHSGVDPLGGRRPAERGNALLAPAPSRSASPARLPASGGAVPRGLVAGAESVQSGSAAKLLRGNGRSEAAAIARREAGEDARAVRSRQERQALEKGAFPAEPRIAAKGDEKHGERRPGARTKAPVSGAVGLLRQRRLTEAPGKFQG